MSIVTIYRIKIKIRNFQNIDKHRSKEHSLWLKRQETAKIHFKKEFLTEIRIIWIILIAIININELNTPIMDKNSWIGFLNCLNIYKVTQKV